MRQTSCLIATNAKYFEDTRRPFEKSETRSVYTIYATQRAQICIDGRNTASNQRTFRQINFLFAFYRKLTRVAGLTAPTKARACILIDRYFMEMKYELKARFGKDQKAIFSFLFNFFLLINLPLSPPEAENDEQNA